jgi:membrane-bound lytic murein transglycosylase D
MKKFIVSLFLLCSLYAFCQVKTADSSFIFNDDPIASMLDSLARLKYFEAGYKSNVRSNKYHFAPDSVPRYSDTYYNAHLEKLDALSPFDLRYNYIVKGYIEMYTIRKRELVSRMMALSQFYFPLFEEMLDKYNLPLELKYLAICESALNPLAKSRCGAMGLWQFMYPTGRLFGLNVSSYVDERCDPYKETVAACEYLQSLYKLFGDWQLVLAAYNGGPGTVNKAIRRSGGKKTYWEIRPYLPRETQGYVPAFIAVNYVMTHTAEHNINSSIVKKWFHEVDTVAVKQQVTFDQLSKVLEMPVEDIQALNPSFKKNVIPYNPEGKLYSLCLPSDKIGSFLTNETAIYNYLKKDTLTFQNLLAYQESMRTIKVKKGESLATIAKKYGCTVADIRGWNSLRSKSVRPGQRLTVYVKKAAASKPLMVASAKTVAPKSTDVQNGSKKFKYYTIQRGDTLWQIANAHGVTLADLKKMNNISSSYKLMPGKKLKVAVIHT